MQRQDGLWRWAELLPVRQLRYRLTLGEGNTALVETPRIGENIGVPRLAVKDESTNPTGSFKDRGLCAAVSRALELGVEEFVIPTAGNAGGSLAAYAALAGARAYVFMPADAPLTNQREVAQYGADLVLVDGLINEAGKQAAAVSQEHGWFDISTLKEPYRLEGKKTMGFEIAAQHNWQLPDVILYPTGGGTGLVGMWKAFHEMIALGWIENKLPRMVSVQASGCAPVVKAIQENAERAEIWQNAHTRASGLRVPLPFADRLVLRTIRESGGTALAVSDEAMTDHQQRLGRSEGIFAAPEGAATLAAAEQLARSGWILPDERVVCFNTGSGLKYT